MRARTESLGIRRLPITSGSQSALGAAGRHPAPARGVSCSWRPARRHEAASRQERGNAATARAMREPLERVRTDFSLMPRKLPLTRFTVKIRTPSLLSKSAAPPRLSRGESSIIWERSRSTRVCPARQTQSSPACYTEAGSALRQAAANSAPAHLDQRRIKRGPSANVGQRLAGQSIHIRAIGHYLRSSRRACSSPAALPPRPGGPSHPPARAAKRCPAR